MKYIVRIVIAVVVFFLFILPWIVTGSEYPPFLLIMVGLFSGIISGVICDNLKI